MYSLRETILLDRNSPYEPAYIYTDNVWDSECVYLSGSASEKGYWRESLCQFLCQFVSVLESA